ncbi:MAG: HAD family phosphatase [Lachnospiraceae bacterium]|nr:HAD family phosphatase [Lachnospiraceae bacterium]
MMSGIKAVIFDLDGTLIDSMWMWKQIDIDYLASKGRPFPPNLQDTISGMSFSETAVYFKKTFELEDDLETIKKCWNDMAYDMYNSRVTLKEGVQEFLEKIKAYGIKTGIATSNSSELAFSVIKRLGIDAYIDEVHTACEVEKGKPAPDIFLFVAEKLGVKPSECLVFEDVLRGVAAGKSAGMRVCACYDAASEYEDEEKRQIADCSINSFAELMQ